MLLLLYIYKIFISEAKKNSKFYINYITFLKIYNFHLFFKSEIHLVGVGWFLIDNGR